MCGQVCRIGSQHILGNGERRLFITLVLTIQCGNGEVDPDIQPVGIALREPFEYCMSGRVVKLTHETDGMIVVCYGLRVRTDCRSMLIAGFGTGSQTEHGKPE